MIKGCIVLNFDIKKINCLWYVVLIFEYNYFILYLFIWLSKMLIWGCNDYYVGYWEYD